MLPFIAHLLYGTFQPWLSRLESLERAVPSSLEKLRKSIWVIV